VSVPASEISVPVSAGELFDKLSILAIKRERFTDAAKRANVERELARLDAVRRDAIGDPDAALAALVADLRRVNEALWQIEDDIRDCERERDFGPRFVELARAVYLTNDRRSELKRAIDARLGSAIREEKQYADYSGA
jgi:hypothetical protein